MLYLSEFPGINSAMGMMLPILLAQEATSQAPETNSTTSAGSLIGYLIMAFFCYKIYQKLNIENAWFAWIPILGTYINFKAADEEKPVLWTILACIPLINIMAGIKLIMAWVTIFKKLDKSPLLLLICIIPCAVFFVFGYVAFT